MTDAPLSPDHQDMAAELALGLLDGAERAEATRLCLADTAFAAEVETWGHRLSPLWDAAPAEPPPAWIWNAIDARVGDRRAVPSARSLRLWRGGAMLSGALAACLALFLVIRPPASQSPQSVAVSQLTDPRGAMAMAVRYDPRTGILRLGANALESGQKSPELWIIPQDGVPRSLGIIGQRESELPIGADLRQFLKAGAILAITLEDRATAPHRAPTSAPILTGKISII